MPIAGQDKGNDIKLTLAISGQKVYKVKILTSEFYQLKQDQLN